jgi:hypothetical protein
MTNLPHAPHLNMDERRDQADEFFAATKPELVPMVSDEATWFDFDCLSLPALAQVIAEHYGIALDENELRLPFWQFLDYLNERRTL